MDCTICVVKKKALISFAYAKGQFSHKKAQIRGEFVDK